MDTRLYPGIPFSPPAALTDNIGAGDTIIPVSDASAFPEAPNLATIGTDEGGETVLYHAKTAAALSGCERGVEGAARAWAKGEAIARNWTAKDHEDLIAAVSEVAVEVEEAVAAAGAAEDAGEAARAAQEAAEGAASQAAGAAQAAQTAAQDAAQAREDARAAAEASVTAQAVSEAAQGAAASAAEAADTAERMASAAQGAAAEAVGAAQEAKALAEARASMEQVEAAIQAAVLDSWEGAY